MPSINISADAARAISELNNLNSALSANSNRISEIDIASANYNKQGRLVSATIRSQIDEFSRLEQKIKVVRKALVGGGFSERLVVQKSTYKDDLEAERRAREAQNATDARTFAAAQKRRDTANAQRAREDAAYNLRVATRTGGFGGPGDDDNNKASLFEGIMNRIGRNLVQFASFRTFNAISQGLTDGVKAAKDFEIQLSLIRTISQDNQQTFSKFGADVRGVSDNSGIDIKQVGKAFYDTVSNQIAKGADVKEFVKVAADLARVTGGELPDAVNTLSSRINSYGLSVSDATKLSAQMFRTVDEGRIVLSEYANTIGRVDVLAHGLGVSSTDVDSFLAITTQKGLKTADAMTLLTNVLIKLEKPTDALKGFFTELGVNSGEAAVKLYGFTGIMEKLVVAFKSGKLDVSSVFDEIRGRKGAAVFEQSIDDIKKFKAKLEDTQGTNDVFENAKTIRGESNADLLVKQLNQLSNVFKVDLGQVILKTAADFIKFTGGVDALKNSAGIATEVLKGTGIAIFTLGTLAGLAKIEVIGLWTSTKYLAGGLVSILTPLAAVTAGYLAFKEASKEEAVAGVVADPKTINSSIEALDRYVAAQKKAMKELTPSGNKETTLFSGLDDQKKVVGETFKEVLGLIAQANIANNKFLDDAKEKSKQVSEALKVSFSTWADRLQDKIARVKHEITEARAEIEKSVKAQVTFSDKIADTKSDTRLKYGSDDIRIGNQKEQLLQKRIASLQARAASLFGSTNKEEIDEGRKLFDEIVHLEQQKFDVQTEFRKKQFEQNIKNDPNATGLQIFGVDTSQFERTLDQIETKKAAFEAASIIRQKELIQIKKQEVEIREAELRTVQAAFKAYENIEVLTKEGKVKPEFADKEGRLDKSKVSTELDTIEVAIRKNAGGTYQERIQLEIELSKKRQALFTEASAQERAEFLKTAQTKTLTASEQAIKDLNTLKTEREEKVKQQTALTTSIGEKSNQLALFAQRTTSDNSFKNVGLKQDIQKGIDEYNKLVTEAFDDADKNKKDGVLIFDPQKIAAIGSAYDKVADLIIDARNKIAAANDGRAPNLNLKQGERTISLGESKAAIGQELNELQQNQNALGTNFGKETALKDAFQLTTKAQIDDLTRTVPELAGKADAAAKSINDSFNRIDAIKELRKQLMDVEDTMKRLNISPDGKKKAMADEGIAPAYAASGGMAGMFPGQPRGIDKYPVWMAAGERVLDRDTSALYAPMLDAMVNRRMPSYMANGGIAGDTQVGDISISVTVQGGESGSQTGRDLAATLRRELRRNNIRL